jgi:hypothetical protein
MTVGCCPGNLIKTFKVCFPPTTEERYLMGDPAFYLLTLIPMALQ